MTSAFAPLVPVNTAVMAGVLGQEQLTKRIVAGMALALSGTFSILHVETLGEELTTDRTGGILVLLFQNWTYATYLVSLKQIMKGLPFPVGIYFGALCPCEALVVHAESTLCVHRTPRCHASPQTTVGCAGARRSGLRLRLAVPRAHLAAVSGKQRPHRRAGQRCSPATQAPQHPRYGCCCTSCSYRLLKILCDGVEKCSLAARDVCRSVAG